MGCTQNNTADSSIKNMANFEISFFTFRDGFISNEELFTVLKMMTGDNLTDLQLHQIVNRTILYLDKDTDGKISLEEFTQGMISTICKSVPSSLISLKYLDVIVTLTYLP